MRLFLALTLAFVFTVTASAQARKKKPDVTTYFSCLVKEPHGKKTVDVTVKFAVKNLHIGIDNTGELNLYPGLKEDDGNGDGGAISVTPKEGPGKFYAIMNNLNAQGGDLRLEGNGLRLWGDGDGYQFTDLVIFDLEQEREIYDGYVRDYGPTYGSAETFKQFIKCRRSLKVL